MPTDLRRLRSRGFQCGCVVFLVGLVGHNLFGFYEETHAIRIMLGGLGMMVMNHLIEVRSQMKGDR